MTTNSTPLPKIIRFDGVTDSGEFGNATCPHCGADGRYVYHFTTTEGTAGAMAGCIKRFPVSPIAKAQQGIMDKQRTGKNLNGWDRKILEACDAAVAGTMTEDEALHVIKCQDLDRKAWIAKKYRGR